MADVIVPLLLVAAIVGYCYFFLWQSSSWSKRYTWSDDGASLRKDLVPNDHLTMVDVQPSKPNFVFDRYNFREMDVTQTPPDPTDFFDELWVEAKDIDRDSKWTDVTTVCTPKGLSRVMKEETRNFALANGFLFIRRYDLPVILNAVMADIERLPRESDERATETSS